MRFFERLAPTVRARHALRPVLPARTSGAVGSVGARQAEAGAEAASRMSPAALAPTVQTTTQGLPTETSRFADPSAGHDPSTIETHANGVDGSTVRSSEAPAQALAARLDPAALADSAENGAAYRATSGSTAALTARLHASVDTALVAPPPDVGLDPFSDQSADAPFTTNAPARPLNTSPSAHRTATSSTYDTTVIHVTIDRIDVRAAPTPGKPPAAPARPRAASTVPLADYLRRGRS